MPGLFDDIPAKEGAPIQAAPAGLFDDIPGSEVKKEEHKTEAHAESPMSFGGALRAIGSGLLQGGIGLAGMPGDTQADVRGILPQAPPQQATPPGLYGQIIDLLNKARGAAELPTSAGISQATGADKLDYQPQNSGEGYLKTGGEFAPMLLNEAGAVKSAPAAVKALIHTFAPAAASEAAGQATAGTPAEPYARMGAALLTGSATHGATRGLEESRIAAKAPSLDMLKADTSGRYTGLTARNGAIPVANSELNDLADNITASLNKTGPRPSVAPGIHAAINEIRTPATANLGDVSDLVSARQNVKQLLGAPDANKAGAVKALPMIEAEIERLSPGTMKELQRADKDWALVRGNENLDKKIARAELRAAGDNSGLNFGNKIRQKTTDFLVSNDAHYLPSASQDILKGVVKGTIPENVARFASNVLGGGGGLGMTVLGMAGAAGGGYFGGKEGALEGAALPILGLGARFASNRMTARHAQRAAALLRSQSSLGGAPRLPTGSSLPPAALAALLAARGGQAPQ